MDLADRKERGAQLLEKMLGSEQAEQIRKVWQTICPDFENYVIADRLGMTVEFIPHLFGTANQRPTGQRGLLAPESGRHRRDRLARAQRGRGRRVCRGRRGQPRP